MAKPVKYNSPRRLNPVSITLFALLGLLGYFAYQYVPIFMLKQDVHRLVEEAGSTMYGHRGLYKSDATAREQLRRTLESQLRNAGVDDPELETWIDFQDPEMHLGAIYSEWLHWPFELFPQREIVVEVEQRFDFL